MRRTCTSVSRRAMGRAVQVACVAIALMALAACAPIPPLPGQSSQDVFAQWGQPTARYNLPAGSTRLEYATGPYGRTTWMIDVDSSGRVLQARQVLTEGEFAQVQHATGLSRQDLLRWLGTPSERRGGGWAGGEVWSWRYPTMDCRWFQASVSDAGLVTSSAYAEDPVCEVVDDATP
jgi:hypothetical protein